MHLHAVRVFCSGLVYVNVYINNKAIKRSLLNGIGVCLMNLQCFDGFIVVLLFRGQVFLAINVCGPS